MVLRNSFVEDPAVCYAVFRLPVFDRSAQEVGLGTTTEDRCLLACNRAGPWVWC
jgi:hypothetical protein